ncbi:MAG: hypothetical protein IKJ65_01320, partial [Clostridia bacterium]|nr:hypothetical protein [Clostridia bacterium]
ERERTPSPFSIDFGGMYGKIARFHKAQRLKTLPLSDPRPEIPKNFRGIGPSHQKRHFFDDLTRLL